MLKKFKQPIAATESIVAAEWQPLENGDIMLVGGKLTFINQAFIYGYEKQYVGESGYKLDMANPLPLPANLPQFQSAEHMLQWILTYFYETENNKLQIGAD